MDADDSFAKKKADRDAEIARIKASNAQKQMEYQGKVTKAKRESMNSMRTWPVGTMLFQMRCTKKSVWIVLIS